MKRRFTIFVAAASMFAASAAFAGTPLPAGSYQVATGGSCQSWFSTCAARCKAQAGSDRNCISNQCSPKISECHKSGCWQESPANGGAKTCNLVKQ